MAADTIIVLSCTIIMAFLRSGIAWQLSLFCEPDCVRTFVIMWVYRQPWFRCFTHRIIENIVDSLDKKTIDYLESCVRSLHSYNMFIDK